MHEPRSSDSRSTVDETVPAVEEAYSAYKPILFDALSTLARRGYVVPPTEGLDLIHDFFLEAWPGLQERFDPEKGTVESYVYGAFLRFARPRIVRLNKLRSRLLDPEELETTQTSGQQSQTLQKELDSEIVGQALEELPTEERNLLLAYLGPEPSSQRSLARKRDVSRYRIRETLAQALARFATHVEKPDFISEGDWHLTKLVLREGLSIKDAAAELDISVSMARKKYAHAVNSLRKGLKEASPNSQ